MFSYLKTNITVLAVCLSLFSFGQTQLYLEDFTGQDGKGFNGLTTDTSGVSWTIDTNLYSNFSTDPNNKFVVSKNSRFECKNQDGYAYWLSSVVDANPIGSNYERYVVSVDIIENTGSLEVDSDTIRAEYSVNGSGTWVTFSKNGEIAGEVPSGGVVASSLITGGPVTSIQIRVTSHLQGGSAERHLWDNIAVYGYEAGDVSAVENDSVISCLTGEVDLSWDKHVSHVNSTDEILVFIKQGSAVNLGVPTNAASTYTASTTFGSGTAYENDASAYCVYSGDGSNVTITGLTAGQTYHYLIYNTYGSPTGYSTDVTNSVAVNASVENVPNVTLIAAGTEIASSWTSPVSCHDGFIVAINTNSISGVPAGTYSVNSTDYTDATNPTLSDGSVVVYSGTGNSVTIDGLTTETEYYVKVFSYYLTNYSSGNEEMVNSGVNPVAGDFIITEATDGNNGFLSYMELYNLTDQTLLMSTCKVVELDASNSVTRIFDIGTEGSGDLTMEPHGFYVMAKNADLAAFEASYGALPANANYRTSSNQLRPNKENIHWRVRCGGTPNSDDGVIVDDIGGAIKGQARAYQYPKGNWIRTSDKNPLNPGSFGDEDDPTINADMAYNGEWRGGTPSTSTGSQTAVVSYGTAIFTSNASLDSIEVRTDASISISSNATLTIGKDVVNNGVVTIESGSSLLQTQTADNNSGSGSYQIQRNTGTLVDDTRYQFWSSPVTSATMGGVFSGSNASDFYYFDEGATNTWASQANGAIMTPGRGYITTGTVEISGSEETRSFEGQVNNGTVSLSTSAVSSGEYILVGNPYPSAISNASFVADNSGIDGTLWFWNHSTPENGGVNSDADYATWTGVGSTGGNSSENPDDYIQSCQGFFVKSSSANPTISFQNDQRVESNNTQFFKTSSGEKHRIWLNLMNDQSDYNQILVGFMDGATDDVDQGLDGEKFKAHPRISFYSILNMNHYSIQGVSKVEENETKIIPLGIDAWVPGTYKISLDSLDQWPDLYHAFLLDTKLDSSINLRSSKSYSFEVDSAMMLSDRFLLVVNHEEDQTTSTSIEEEVFEKELYQIIQTPEELVIRVVKGHYSLDEITVSDVSGRVVKSWNQSTRQIRISTSNWKNGIYIISGQTSGGTPIQKKIVKM